MLLACSRGCPCVCVLVLLVELLLLPVLVFEFLLSSLEGVRLGFLRGEVVKRAIELSGDPVSLLGEQLRLSDFRGSLSFTILGTVLGCSLFLGWKLFNSE